MLKLRTLIHFLPLLVCYFPLTSVAKFIVFRHDLTRRNFPLAFTFGAGTSAYQVEGAAFEDGKSASTADSYGHSGLISDNGDVASDEYHKYKDDVRLMAETGLDAYRFSISWSRLLPHGREPVNPKGLAYYNNLINELVTNGIEPHVTLMHSDVPLVLEHEYGGFTTPRIVEDFTAYANVCFREFGDRVKHWTTINEANIFAFATYQQWRSPHRRCYSSPIDCTNGNVTKNSSDEQFLIAHHVLLAHASSARLYKEKYQVKQHGFLGFSLYSFYFTPISDSKDDIMATQRSYDFFIDWFLHPLMYGDYPETVKKAVGADLPVFTKSESNLMKGTIDFIGLNYYATVLVEDNPSSLKLNKNYLDYIKASWTYIGGNDPLKGYPFPNTPWGLQGVLEHFKHVYNNLPIFILENGQLTNYTSSSVNDLSRVEYIRDHIGSLLDAVSLIGTHSPKSLKSPLLKTLPVFHPPPQQPPHTIAARRSDSSPSPPNSSKPVTSPAPVNSSSSPKTPIRLTQDPKTSSPSPTSSSPLIRVVHSSHSFVAYSSRLVLPFGRPSCGGVLTILS